mmetsp:Transcript_14271/g.20733  ORF Transcript_14271/g.20733 Transcript_14271/m.20733 type:complete len:368 (+) Transcript_14271:450-1553(+)
MVGTTPRNTTELLMLQRGSILASVAKEGTPPLPLDPFPPATTTPPPSSSPRASTQRTSPLLSSPPFSLSSSPTFSPSSSPLRQMKCSPSPPTTTPPSTTPPFTSPRLCVVGSEQPAVEKGLLQGEREGGRERETEGTRERERKGEWEAIWQGERSGDRQGERVEGERDGRNNGEMEGGKGGGEARKATALSNPQATRAKADYIRKATEIAECRVSTLGLSLTCDTNALPTPSVALTPRTLKTKIGLVLDFDHELQCVSILHVTPGSIATSCRPPLVAGSILEKVSGEFVGASLDHAHDLIRRSKGSILVLDLIKPGHTQPTRARIFVPQSPKASETTKNTPSDTASPPRPDTPPLPPLVGAAGGNSV